MPNLLFIQTDQQRRDAMSCMGSRFVHTPNMDRLAHEGVRFTNAVTPCPICVPARASILTGLPIHSTGCILNPDAKIDGMCDDIPSFDSVLTDAGYTAEYYGKWHAPASLMSCYSRTLTSADYRAYLERHGYSPAVKDADNPFISSVSGHLYDPDPTDHAVRVAETGHGHNRAEPGLEYGRDTMPPEMSLSAMTANESIKALTRLKDGPFSITCSFLFPHDPVIVPRPFCDMVPESDMIASATLDDRRNNTQYEKFTWQIDDVEREYMRLIMARYYAATLEVDHHVGRLLDALDTLGLTDDTLVIFTSDHGEMLGDHGLICKFVHYRESVGVPLLMRMPGRISAGGTVVTPACLTDLYATITDYLGVEPSEQHGASLRTLVDGTDSESDRTVFSQFEHWNVMAQSRKLKYIWSNKPDEVDMLFDLENDPQEVTNLLGTNPDRARHMDAATMMKQRLADWMEQTEHPWLDNVVSSEVR
jgi:arylsulfatase A-like enzyme